MPTMDECRRNAEQCLRWADEAANDQQRETLLEIARLWTQMELSSAEPNGVDGAAVSRFPEAPVKAHPHMLRHACGYALANKGHDTRALQAYLGHRNIQHTVRYTELSPTPVRDFWRRMKVRCEIEWKLSVHLVMREQVIAARSTPRKRRWATRQPAPLRFQTRTLPVTVNCTATIFNENQEKDTETCFCVFPIIFSDALVATSLSINGAVAGV